MLIERLRAQNPPKAKENLLARFRLQLLNECRELRQTQLMVRGGSHGGRLPLVVNLQTATLR